MSDNRWGSGGIGFVGLLQIVFITLKLLKVIDWAWGLVLLPLFISLGIAIIIIVIAVIVAINN